MSSRVHLAFVKGWTTLCDKPCQSKRVCHDLTSKQHCIPETCHGRLFGRHLKQ